MPTKQDSQVVVAGQGTLSKVGLVLQWLANTGANQNKAKKNDAKEHVGCWKVEETTKIVFSVGEELTIKRPDVIHGHGSTFRGRSG
jgi:hypothetical protein